MFPPSFITLFPLLLPPPSMPPPSLPRSLNRERLGLVQMISSLRRHERNNPIEAPCPWRIDPWAPSSSSAVTYRQTDVRLRLNAEELTRWESLLCLILFSKDKSSSLPLVLLHERVLVTRASPVAFTSRWPGWTRTFTDHLKNGGVCLSVSVFGSIKTF